MIYPSSSKIEELETALKIIDANLTDSNEGEGRIATSATTSVNAINNSVVYAKEDPVDIQVFDFEFFLMLSG